MHACWWAGGKFAAPLLSLFLSPSHFSFLSPARFSSSPLVSLPSLAPQVKYLKIAETHKNYKPYRWVRYVTTSNSYVCRL